MRKNFATLITTLVIALFASCGEVDHFEEAAKASEKAVPVAYIPEDNSSVTVVYSDGTFEPRVPHTWTLTAQDTIKTMGTESFKATERLEKIAQNEMVFGYNYDKTNRLTVTGLAMSYKGKTIYPKDPSMMLVKGSREVAETAAKPFYELSATNYQLVYGALVLASARQMFIVDEGYVPSFERMEWSAEHVKGTAKAAYAASKVTIECVDSLRAWERWDDASLKNWLRTIYHSQDVFNTTISGTEVSSFSAVLNKDMTISGNKATIAEFSVEFTLASKTIKESKINYTYNNKSINFVDSLTACGYSLKGAKLTSKTNLHVVFTLEGDDVNVDIPVNITEKEVPAKFQKMFWNAEHNRGTTKASYANAKVTVECTDSLRAWERWDDSSFKNWLRTIYHSQNVFSTTISGTEVTSISAVLNKDMSISGNKATIAEFSVTFNLISKTIKESKINYTYNNKSINFVDSLTACGYSLKGAKLTSKTNLHVVFTHEGDDVNVDIPVNITEKVTLKEILRNYIHKAFRKVASVSGNIITIICDNNGEMTKVFSNNTKEKSDVPYTWTFKFTYNVPSGLTTDVIGHTYNFNNGSTNVEGKSVTVSFSSSSISDIMFEGKNYKNEAPKCSVEVKTITFNSKTQATVTFEGEGENVTAQVPVNLTEPTHDPDFPGRIIWGGATDSYVDGANVATWEGCYMHFIVENNGTYKVYSRKVGSTGAWRESSVSAAYVATISNSRAVAYIGNTVAGYSLGSCQWQNQGNWYKIVYFDYNGNVARVISEISKTIGGESSNNCRMPLRGTWANGKITVDGTTYVVTGSQN